ncbi:sigma-54-dependent Fis family transcriptional regulator [Pseudonocardia halophobica]|uniref:sigma-54-dependent Fis family transcriptional regulator n=1 Tax=Pseudonocardia halophobica TaxID=29401 RepID=UPI003D92109E
MATDRLAPPYRPGVDPESRLLRAAGPVLDAMNARLGELGVSFLLTDANARILERRVENRRLLHTLDSLHITPGFVFAEDAVGTNGVGTAVELGRTTRIDGHEHYVDELVRFTCVGVPIMDPLTRRPMGIVDITCGADRDNGLVTVLAEQTAKAIEQRLFEQQTIQERALLAHFLSSSRRSHAGILVLNDRVQMTNPQAARLLDGVDQPLLWDHVARVLAGSCADGTVDSELPLPGGRSARTRTMPLRDGGAVIGALVEIRPAAEPTASARPARVVAPDGLAGTDRAFLWACRAARAALAARTLVLCGEPGVGKAAVGSALLRERGDDPLVCDAARAEVSGLEAWFDELRVALAGPPGALLLRHLDLLDGLARRRLSAILGDAGARGWRCAATFTCASSWDDMVLPGLDADQLRLPPLRNRLRDIPTLVAAFAAPRRFAPEAVQLLMRLSWPGNIGELRRLVGRVLEATPGGAVPGLADLPPEVRRAAPRLTLTRFERAEIHAILDAMAETGGNKKDAAALLGISRSTLYRKLQAAGIDLDNTTF